MGAERQSIGRMSTAAQPGQSTGIHLSVAGDRVLVALNGIQPDNRLTLFLTTLMGGQRTELGWDVPIRNRSSDELVVRVNRWLVDHHYPVVLVGDADESVSRDLERTRSFTRTMQAATLLRQGGSQISEDQVSAALQSANWNFANRTLRPHQMQAVIHGLTVTNPANFSVPGAGKTAATLALAAIHLSNNTIDLVLVIGPLSCFRPWEAEAAAAAPLLKPRRIRGAAVERRRRIRDLERGDLALISYASAAADRVALMDLCRRHRVMLVADESHRIKRFSGGTWAPAVIDIAKHARVRAVLSGTPMPQSGKDLYTQLNVMWPGRELTGPRDRFKSRVQNNYDLVLRQVLPFVSRTAKADLGLEPPRFAFHEVPLNEDEAEVYRLVQDNLRTAVLAAGPREADRLAALRRGRPMRLLQAASNPALLRTGEPGSVPLPSSPTVISRIDALDPVMSPPAKFVRALELIRELEPREKVVVWSNFVQNLDWFADYLRRETTLGVYQVDGRVQAGDDEHHPPKEGEPETREQVIAGFLNHDGSAVLVTNPASCSESISLHSACHNAIYLDRTYDCAQWLQSIDRIHRLGLPPDVEVRIHVLQATANDRPTTDALIQNSLLQKDATMRQLLEGAQLRPFNLVEDPVVAASGDEQDLKALLEFLLGQAQ